MNRDFYLTAKQKNKFASGGAIQLSNKQLNNNSEKANHHVQVAMNNEGCKKHDCAMRNQKGFRLTPNHHSGGSLLSDVKKTFNKSKKLVSSGISTAGKTVSTNYNKVSKAMKKADIGGIIEQAKSAIPPEVTSTVIKAGLMASGMDEMEANVVAGSATGSLYAVDFSRDLNGQGGDAASGAVIGGIQSISSGSGFGNIMFQCMQNKNEDLVSFKTWVVVH